MLWTDQGNSVFFGGGVGAQMLWVVNSPPSLPLMAEELTRNEHQKWRNVRHNVRLQCRRSILSPLTVWRLAWECIWCRSLLPEEYLWEETVWEWTKLLTVLEVFKVYLREFLFVKLKSQVLLWFFHPLCGSLTTRTGDARQALLALGSPSIMVLRRSPTQQ